LFESIEAVNTVFVNKKIENWIIIQFIGSGFVHEEGDIFEICNKYKELVITTPPAENGSV
jgi:hypothetical protein